MRVPLTLAIIPALVVMSGGQSFAVPQSVLVELVYVGRDEVATAVERMGEAELYRLRDRLLPLVRLDRLLRLEQTESEGFYLAVLEVDGCRFGLVLDDLLAPEEIVVKPLSNVLREIGVFSGATVLGNGTLSLILDGAAIAARAGVSGLAEEITRGHAAKPVAEEVIGQRFLMFEAGLEPERMAMPLDQVERIETVTVQTLEFAGGGLHMQYADGAIPVVAEGGVLDRLRADGLVTVLICRREASRVGMVVREVFQVAAGTMLPAAAGAEPMAFVEGRLTTVREAFRPYPRMLREVA